MLLSIAAGRGLRAVPEAFADRGYTPGGTLLHRSENGAVLSDAAQVARRAVQMATEGTVQAVDGTDIPVRADSICVHGDTPDAVRLAEAVVSALRDAGVSVRAFA
jgi:UPF0271 protein